MERLEVTYSYWDGSGHRREIVLNKGITVGELHLCGLVFKHIYATVELCRTSKQHPFRYIHWILPLHVAAIIVCSVAGHSLRLPCNRFTTHACPAPSAGKFLEMVRQQLSQDFSEMRSVSSENLLYIKEDLIIPHVRRSALSIHASSLFLSTGLLKHFLL